MQIAPNVPLNLSTQVIARVARLPYIGEPIDKPLRAYEVKISAVPIPEPKPDIVPLWIIILSACVGVIILLLLIYILYKVTFFQAFFPSTFVFFRCKITFRGEHSLKTTIFLSLVWILQATSTGSFTRASTTKPK